MAWVEGGEGSRYLSGLEVARREVLELWERWDGI